MPKQKEASDLELFRVLFDSLVRNKNTRDVVVDICETYITNKGSDDDTPEMYGESQDPSSPMIDVHIPELDEGDDSDLFHEDDKDNATEMTRIEYPAKDSALSTLSMSSRSNTVSRNSSNKRPFTKADIIDLTVCTEKTSALNPIILMDVPVQDDNVLSYRRNKSAAFKKIVAKTKYARMKHTTRNFRVKSARPLLNVKGKSASTQEGKKSATHSQAASNVVSSTSTLVTNQQVDGESDFFKEPIWMKEMKDRPREGSSQWYMMMYHRARKGKVDQFPQFRNYWGKSKAWFLNMSYKQKAFETAHGLEHD